MKKNKFRLMSFLLKFKLINSDTGFLCYLNKCIYFVRKYMRYEIYNKKLRRNFLEFR